MAVYERTYRRYSGPLTAERRRIVSFPRYAFDEVFRSKLFLALCVVCLLWPLVIASILYLPHNLGFLKLFNTDSATMSQIFRFDAKFFYDWLMTPQIAVAFVITFLVGPALVTADLRNNGLALYFSRPLSRTEYVIGKSSILVLLLSALTWIPDLLVFGFQVYLEGTDWLAANWRAAIGLAFGMWIWILLLCLVSIALSAYVKWKPVARLSMVLVFIVAAGLATVLNLQFRTDWASVINLTDMIHVIVTSLFGVPSNLEIPPWAAWLSVLLACLVCVGLLARKLRPYEVVR
jgi:ABC-2 type transport system permease protein